jgi:hypothetical protein
LFQIVNGVDAGTGKVNHKKKPKFAFERLKSSSRNVLDFQGANKSSRNVLANMSKTASGDQSKNSRRNQF